MEDWATVLIIAIMGAVSWFTADRQIKNSREQFKMHLVAEKEVDRRGRQREVRDEPLLKLRDELARMSGMLRRAVDLEIQFGEEVTGEADEILKELEEAVKEFDAYLKSGEFFRTLCMQYDYEIRFEAHDILMDYQSAYNGIREVWSGGKKERAEAIKKAIDVVQQNDVRVSELQSKIMEQREEL